MTFRHILSGLLVLFFIPAAAAAEDNLLTLEGYLDLERVVGRGTPGPQVSPDGSQIIYTRAWIDRKKDRWTSALWIMNADGSKNRELLRGSGARWSPDGSRIAFSTKGDDDNVQLFVRWMDDEGAVTQITRGDQRPSQFSWSPDSASIVFRATVPYEPIWKLKLPGKPKGAEWTKDATVIDKVHFRLDRRGLTKGFEHLYIVPAEGGTARQLTSGNWNVGTRNAAGALDWTPDGSEILFNGIASDDAEMRFLESYIYAVNVESGDIRQLTGDEGSWAQPRISPDGKKVAFSGFNAEKAKITAPHGELYVMDIDGANVTRLTDRMNAGPNQIQWAKNGSGIYFSVSSEGTRNIHFADLKGRVRDVTEGSHMLSLSAISDRGLGVGTLVAADQPGDIVSIDLRKGDIDRLTHVNDDILHGKTLATLEEIWTEAPDGQKVHGWIQLPPDFDASKKYPTILQIHGGPHGMYNVGFNYMRQLQAADGYITVYINPRGSDGYGEPFANLIENSYPGPDFQDLMAGLDAAIAKGYVDEDRLFVWGCSGGGVLTSWTVSHTDRFKAAAALCPVINWISFAGQADIAAWAYKRFDGYFWDDPTNWLEHSPIMHVGKVNTPTLLMTGDLDMRTPIAQAEEFYTALKMRGVPTRLVIMHGENHGTTSKPSNFMRTFLIVKQWFEEFGGPESDEVAAAMVK